MGVGFAPTWLRQVSVRPPTLLHKTTLTTAEQYCHLKENSYNKAVAKISAVYSRKLEMHA